MLLCAFAFSSLAADPAATATVTDDAVPANWFDGLIPLLAPALIALVKVFVPRIPREILPWLAPLLGAGIDWLGSLAGLSAGNPVMGALLGASGVAVREALDQAKKRIAQGGTLPSFFVIVIVITAPACARFTTTQTDLSYEQGQPSRSITTRASATTFAASSSALAKFKATQSDKTQGASVGSLEQESDASKLLDAVVQAAVKAGAATVKP